MGDFYARIVENIKRYEKVMDKRGFGMSENSERFADLPTPTLSSAEV